KQVSTYFAYNEPDAEDEGKFHHYGYINDTLLNSALPGTDTACYFCGPKPFMRAMYKNLTDYGMNPKISALKFSVLLKILQHNLKIKWANHIVSSYYDVIYLYGK